MRRLNQAEFWAATVIVSTATALLAVVILDPSRLAYDGTGVTRFGNLRERIAADLTGRREGREIVGSALWLRFSEKWADGAMNRGDP